MIYYEDIHRQEINARQKVMQKLQIRFCKFVLSVGNTVKLSTEL